MFVDLLVIRFSWIHKIVIVVSEENVDHMQTLLSHQHGHHRKTILIAKGASTRHRSIFNGLKELATGNIL